MKVRRATCSRVLGFGLVSIPTKLFAAAYGPGVRRRLTPETDDRLDVLEFVPLNSLDVATLGSSYELRPGPGGDRGGALLARAMARTKRAAVCRMQWRRRRRLVVVRPYRGGLLLSFVLDAAARAPEHVGLSFRPVEEELAERLIGQLSTDAFDPARYAEPDEEAVREASNVIDLFAAIRSLIERERKPPTHPANDCG